MADNQTPLDPGPASLVNVNSRYFVESIEVIGNRGKQLSRGIQQEIHRLIGTNLDDDALRKLAGKLRVELHAKSVEHRILRGQRQDQVKVVFEITPKPVEFDVSVPRFLYHSRQGWTAEAQAALTFGDNTMMFGVLSDNDELTERNSGIRARYERRRLFSSSAVLVVDFLSLRQQWNGASEVAFATISPLEPGSYRTRQNLEPGIRFGLAPGLTLTSGASFQWIENQFPAAQDATSRAVVNTLRYHRQWEEADGIQQDLDAGYSLRAATKALGSDFAYARHSWDVLYALKSGRQGVLAHFTAGRLTGQAPIFERYILGNSSTLRGWNRFDIDPLGGTRMVHNSLEYRYGLLQVFYDTGAVWSRRLVRTVRHSAGIGLRKDGFTVALAFPLREGRIEPIVLAGMNF